MNLAISDRTADTPFWTTESFGTGSASQQIQEALDQISAHARESMRLILKRKGAMDEVEEVGRECSNVNWYGEGARPIPKQALLEARMLIEDLASDIPAPEAAGDPGGALGLQWYFRPNHTLIITFEGDGIARYAALLGPNRTAYGTEPFTGTMPAEIERLLRDLIATAR